MLKCWYIPNFQSKVMSFVNSLKKAYTLESKVESVLSTHISISFVTDSQFLFDVQTKAICITKKALIAHIHTAQNKKKVL